MRGVTGGGDNIQWQTNPLHQDQTAKTTNPTGTATGTGAPAVSPHNAKGSHGILSGSELVARMGGAPKADVTFFGKTVHTNSVAYKEALGHLESYQSQLSGLVGQDIATLDRGTINALKTELHAVVQAADDYETKHANSDSKTDRRNVMGEVRQMAREELMRLNDLSSVRTGGKPIDLPDTLVLMRGGVTDVSQFNKAMNDAAIDQSRSKDNFGAGKANSVSLLAYGTDVRVVKSISKDASKLMAGEARTGFDQQDMRTAARNLASADVARELGIGQSIPKPDIVIHNGQAAIAMQRAPGESLIYKHEAPVTDAREIQQYETELARGDLLSLKGYGVRKDDNGVWHKPVTEYKAIPYNDASKPQLSASIQQGLLDLQTLDCLMAQMDRQPENIFIQITGNTAKITGIDNDMCMGPGMKQLDEVDGPRKLGDLKKTYGGPPPLMSRSMYTELQKLTDDKFKALLGTEFSAEEVSAAVGRLNLLKAHADKLNTDGKIVDNFETWRGADAKTGLQVGVGDYLKSCAERSYVTRDSGTQGRVKSPLVPLDMTKH